MGESERAYTVADEAALARVVEAIGERFATEGERTSRRRVYYDTFDWRLWRANGRLWSEPVPRGVVRLNWQVEGRPWPAMLEVAPERIGFAQDLPPGPFREALASSIEMRRLLPMVEVRAESRLVRVLDGRRKTVVRLIAEVPGVRSPGSRRAYRPLDPGLVVQPVRGYAKEFQRVSRFLERELELDEGRVDEFEVGAPLGGHGEPGSYASKPSIPLEPSMEADEALREILRALLKVVESNRAGTAADIDSEFLHDFRVAVRRTRSALRLTKAIWPKPALVPFRKELSWLGKVTGPTRDLDVYLLELPRLAASLPESARGDLEPLRRLLEARQAAAQAELAAALGSRRYRRLMDSWRRFVEAPEDEADRPPAARTPIARYADKVIAKAHRRVLERGAAISDDSPPKALHRLRIDCKELRYAMELFRALYPPKKIGRLIRALKSLQENLGSFNDYGVQQQMLGGLADELGTSDRRSTAAVMALGRLLDKLELGEANERAGFAQRFAAFSSKKTVKRFRLMLGAEEA